MPAIDPMTVDLPASTRYLLFWEAAETVISKFINEGKLHHGEIILKTDDGHLYRICEFLWEMYLPDVLNEMGLKDNDPETYDKINAFIGARELRSDMELLGYSGVYPIPLSENPPTEVSSNEEELETD